jgi:hypothetical protein
MRKYTLSILFSIIVLPAVIAQDVKITAAFDSTRIFAGDQIFFTISIDQPSGIKLTIPAFRDTLIKNIEILRGPIIDSANSGNGRLKITEKYLVTSFDSGMYQVVPVYAEVKNPDGLKRFYTDYARLEVLKYRVAPADSTAKIYDIIEPYKAPLTLREILPWLIIALAAAALVWAFLVYMKRFKKGKPGIAEVIIQEPAHIIAFRELERLKVEELWQKGQLKPYYSRLTEILRQYLENRYKVYSLELTTAETLQALIATGFRRDGEYDRLKMVLTIADLVKFAKYIPDSQEPELHYRNSWDFVEATKEIAAVPEELSAKAEPKEGSL